MKITLTLIIAFLLCLTAAAQNTALEFDKELKDLPVGKQDLRYSLNLKKGKVYHIAVLQQGIDVVVMITSGTKTLAEKDSPTGSRGYEHLEYQADESKIYTLIIRRLDEEGNAERGKVNVTVTAVSEKEIARREKIKTELAPENAKTVQTADIDHFWEAFDHLANCRSHADSILAFQEIYLDRATDGLKDFIVARNFTAEKFVQVVRRRPKFYASIRKNTIEAKKAAPLIDEVFRNFSALYPNFKPFKVCFAVGMLSTGGTVSDKFVLIGSEISTCTASVDLSEFNGDALSKVMGQGTDVVQKIKNIVAHECVHTQQKTPVSKKAIQCFLLYRVMQEGFCDFIGELITGSQINEVAQQYGFAHEAELWNDLKKEMCGSETKNWLYNYSDSKEKPADLGYFIGYVIAKEYYANARDKNQAVTDIIEMSNPLAFLEKSGYDQKQKR